MSHIGLYAVVGALLLTTACVKSCTRTGTGTVSSQTCEGNTAQLNCGSHVIKVLTANYGRTDKRVCAKGRPASQITKTNCVLPRAVNVMAGRCDGKSSCSVPATNNVFSDPCGGTYKYLQVTYICVPKSLSLTTCEHGKATLNCGSQEIKVLSANYGRTDKRTCAAGRPANQVTKTNCILPKTLSVMAKRCDGKSSCSVPATNNVFSDPCVGTYKYLQVTYICVPKRLSLTCEHGKATLNCGSQQIKVLSANYGRTDKRTCAAGRPANQVTKTNCILPKTLSVMAKRCDGRTSCSLYATNTVFSDPCYGTFKYLKAHYMCLPPKKHVVACEGSTARLACGSNQVIRVDSANYGRHNRKTCSSGRPCNQISNTSCSRPSTKVADRCNGKRQCNFRAVNSEFGDPCYGTYKYLDVSYHCLP